jgi:hypothetical protein
MRRISAVKRALCLALVKYAHFFLGLLRHGLHCAMRSNNIKRGYESWRKPKHWVLEGAKALGFGGS